MNCPECNHGYSYVVDSRPKQDSVWRRRQCQKCKATWTTVETGDLSDRALKRFQELLDAAAESLDQCRGCVKAMKSRGGLP